MNALIRLPEVLRLRGRRKTAHYSDIAAGLFTHPVPIGTRAVAWPAHEVEALNAARIAGRTDDETADRIIEELRRVDEDSARECINQIALEKSEDLMNSLHL